MEQIFRDFSEKILIYLAIVENEDPYEKNESTTMLNSIPIPAIVSDYAFSKVMWTMPSVNTIKVKEILVEYKHKNLIEQSYKISIDGEDYKGYKQNEKLQYRKEGNYLRVLCYIERT